METETMPGMSRPIRKVQPKFNEDERRWEAVLKLVAGPDGPFVLGVTSTGIYCRPSCPARKPLRKNVRFYAGCAEAEAAGFRACKRCKPNAESPAEAHAAMIAAACR